MIQAIKDKARNDMYKGELEIQDQCGGAASCESPGLSILLVKLELLLRVLGTYSGSVIEGLWTATSAPTHLFRPPMHPKH
jgi:hypothetical protein